MFDFGAPSVPVANWGVLGFPEALTIYNFIYSRFPSTAGSGLNLRAARRPSPSSGCFVGRKGFAPGIGSLNTTAFERSRSHGRRLRVLRVEALSSIRLRSRCKRSNVWAMLHIWNAHSRAL